MITGLKLSKQETGILKARTTMFRFGSATLLSKDKITFEGDDDFSKAKGKTIYLCQGPNIWSVLPKGSYSLNDNTLFVVDELGRLEKITSTGSGGVATTPADQVKQGWNSEKFNQAKRDSRMDRNVKKDDGSPRATQLGMHRESILYKFSSGILYPNIAFDFPNTTPTKGTTPKTKDGAMLQDGTYTVVSPAGSLTIKNGLVSDWRPVTAIQAPKEEKLNAVKMSVSETEISEYLSEIDGNETLSPEAKRQLKNDYRMRTKAGKTLLSQQNKI